MASANAEEPKRYGAQGNSQARSASKASAISLFEKFRVSDPQITTLLPNAFDYLEEGVLCDREVWEMLAHWILHVYENKTLKGSSAVNTLRTLMVMVSAKFEANGAPCTHTHRRTQTHAHARTHTRTHTHTHTHVPRAGSAETKLFLTCKTIKNATDAARWWKRLLVSLERDFFQRALDNHIKNDCSAPALSREQISAIIRAYTKEGSGEGAERKLTILATVQFGGRPGELPYFALDNMQWDRMNRFPVVTLPMPKVGARAAANPDPKPRSNPNPNPVGRSRNTRSRRSPPVATSTRTAFWPSPTTSRSK